MWVIGAKRLVHDLGPDAVAVAEHAAVFAPQAGHVRAEVLGGQLGGLGVEGLDFAA
jgi:hypothetical protein